MIPLTFCYSIWLAVCRATAQRTKKESDSLEGMEFNFTVGTSAFFFLFFFFLSIHQLVLSYFILLFFFLNKGENVQYTNISIEKPHPQNNNTGNVFIFF